MNMTIASAMIPDPVCNTNSIRTMKGIFILILALLALSPASLHAQARLILNGANINITQSAYLVIENSASDAITRNSGHIITEGQNNVVKWNLGTTTGTYVVPLGYTTNYLPVTFTKTAGTGSGYFLFSTYQTGWQNSSVLPTGVTNINGTSGTDNSAFEMDRFWRVDAQSYTTKPTLSTLTFTYLDAEYSATGNTIIESGLKAKRYNSSLNSWTDNFLTSSVDAAGNTVTVSSVGTSDLFPWWVLGTLGANRYWVAASNSTSNTSANWAAASGGAGNAGIPSNVDAIVFDGSSTANCTLNGDLTASSLVVQSGYTGIISQGSNAITISNAATFSGGTFTGGSGAITVNGPFTLSGTSFTSTSGELNLKNNFTFNSGTFNHNNGTVRFSGTDGTTQIISGSSVANFKNVTVSNTAANPGVSVQSNQNLLGTLTLENNVTMDADGPSSSAILKLISTGDNPTQDAAIAALPANAQITGNVTVQRYMTKEGRNNGNIYRYISSPVQGATVSDLQNEIPVTGAFTGRSTCSGCTTNQSMFSYQESVITDTNNNGTAGDIGDGYINFPASANTETFTAGKGYALFVRGNILSSTLWDLRGTIVNRSSAPVSLPVAYTSSGTLANDGWNLVGNPFASTIDWNAASGWTKTNMETAIYVTDNGSTAATQYASWNGVTGTNGGSRYIALGQGFWVKANGSGVPALTASESVKSSGQQTTFFRETMPSNLLRVTMLKGTIRDETVIHFRDDATNTFDSHADGRKMANTTFNLSTIHGDDLYSINSLAPLNCKATVNLNIDGAATGSYTFDFSEWESFHGAVGITLTDNFIDSVFNVGAGGRYDFAVTASPASYGAARFQINFNTASTDSTFALTAPDVCEGASAAIELKNTQSTSRYQASLNGLSLGNALSGNNNNLQIDIPAEILNTGDNKITMRSYVEQCETFIEKSSTFNVVKKTDPLVTAAKRCDAGAVTLTATGAGVNESYNWYESESSQLPLNEHTGLLETPVLDKSKTYYAAIQNSLGCEGVRKPVKATIEHLTPATITPSGESLISNYRDFNRWYYQDETSPFSTNDFISPEKTGRYRLEVTVDGCQTSAQYEFTKSNPIIASTNTVNNTATTQGEETITTLEEEVPLAIQLSPNPTSGEILLELRGAVDDIREIRLISSIGQLFWSNKLDADSLLRPVKLQLHSYPAGVYIMQIIGDHQVFERKIIKQ